VKNHRFFFLIIYFFLKMNADILAMLSGGGLGVSSSTTNRQADEGKVLVSIKAGKMDAIFQPHNGKFLIKPNDGQRRGVIQLIWQMGGGSTTSSSSSAAAAGTGAAAAIASGVLKFEWKDRRTDAKDYESVIFPEDRCTISKVGRETDRVYLFQYHTATTDTSTVDPQQQRRHFFYLQDKNTEHDEDLMRKFSRLLQSRAACIIEAGGTPTPADYASSSTTSTTASASTAPVASSATTTGTAAASTSTTTPAAVATVDALSSILENLGVPLQPNSTTTTSSATTDINAVGVRNLSTGTTNTTSTSGGILTLSDLQGAMASLATHSPLAADGSTAGARVPPLQEIVTADSVEASGILQDPSVRQRLIGLLPEHQRTEEDLRQNLRSPQVQQALQSLSAAISPNNNNNHHIPHDLTAFHNVIMNFSMNPDDGAIALANGDPIQAFLDCLLASVQREQQGDDADNNVNSKTEEEDENKMEE
jgi:26S proteasome regulatory subunit N13